jgi:hypothetical protein
MKVKLLKDFLIMNGDEKAETIRAGTICDRAIDLIVGQNWHCTLLFAFNNPEWFLIEYEKGDVSKTKVEDKYHFMLIEDFQWTGFKYEARVNTFDGNMGFIDASKLIPATDEEVKKFKKERMGGLPFEYCAANEIHKVIFLLQLDKDRSPILCIRKNEKWHDEVFITKSNFVEIGKRAWGLISKEGR